MVAAESKDSTWDNTGIAKWSCIELNAAIVCGCATTLKPLIQRCFPRIFPGSSGSHGYIYQGNNVDGHPQTTGSGTSKDRKTPTATSTTRLEGTPHAEVFDLRDLEAQTTNSTKWRALGVENRIPGLGSITRMWAVMALGGESRLGKPSRWPKRSFSHCSVIGIIPSSTGIAKSYQGFQQSIYFDIIFNFPFILWPAPVRTLLSFNSRDIYQIVHIIVYNL